MAASTERTVPSVKSFTVPETNYRQAMALADELGMRPLLAHCHFGLGKLLARPETSMRSHAVRSRGS
ncbi:MAG: hypothetical protein DMD89_19325 [Candidatus Rokuibacteriota bacterium]|nr:MAG: hypothetical protein DMD89_19325 [Candidatus Rokubacteria bacterium]